VLVATQRLADLGELAELFGVHLLFGQETAGAAKAALAPIGLDSDAALVAWLLEAQQGLCLMRDLDGRVGVLRFDAVSPELLAALDNTPRETAA
jgi:hypothetical protein